MSIEKLIGTWVAVGFPGLAYNFVSINEGYYSVANAKKEFKYNADNTKIVIYYPGEVSALTFQYEIKEDILLIEDSFGNFVKYKKVKECVCLI
ncbi:MAG: hypothetical protein IJ300_04820 [Clostridia bacterium]|nr:hypothetical protein [Clostridia bacterium]